MSFDDFLRLDPDPNRPQMSAHTHAFVRMMMKANVFVDINPNLWPSQERVLFLTCFDPHRFDHNWMHVRTAGNTCRCCVPLTAPGGALVIPKHSPLAVTSAGRRQDEVYLDNIGLAVAELGTKKIITVVHFPCLAAGLAGLSDIQTLQHNVDAKDRIRQNHPGCDIALLAHVDWHGHQSPTGRMMDTFAFTRQAFDDWKMSRVGRIHLGRLHQEAS